MPSESFFILLYKDMDNMIDDTQGSMPKGCRYIDLPNVTDKRGSIAFGEGGRHIPFGIKRVFWTYAIADEAARGNHAHRTCSMVLFPLGGSFRIELDDGHDKAEILMDDPSRGVLIPPLVWCKLYSFTPQAACISLASEPYTAEDYIHDYEEFLKLTQQK